MAHKAGFVNILGNPNVGKSTLMNRMVGEKLSIITSKSQTTRHRIMGIVNGEDFQIIYSDTPGIIKPDYGLQERMMHFVRSAMDDADLIVYVTDVVETAFKNPHYIERLQKSEVPVLVLINKIDLSDPEAIMKLQNEWDEKLPDARVMSISARKGIGTEAVFDHIMQHLPEHEAYFPKDQLTDKTERFIVSEIIREKIFTTYKQEIPYSTEVVVERFKDEPDIIRIEALIFVTRDSQKGILIGRKGAALKKVGQAARKDIEEFFGKKVFLQTYVKVKKDWRNNDSMLRSLGYHA